MGADHDEFLHFRSRKQQRRTRFSFGLLLLTFMLIISSSCHIVVSDSDVVDLNDSEVVTVSDYSALKAIRQDLTGTGVMRTWKGDRSRVCSSGGWVGITCDGSGHVISIQLPWKGLVGKISPNFGNLLSLRRISLHDNRLTGPVPVSLWLLPNLRGLYLFNNRLSGSIPPSIITSLQNIDLSNNRLSGTIPGNITINNSKKMIYRFNLSYNAFSGSIPQSVTRLPSLAILALQHNNLTGEIPKSIASLKSLESFDVSYNSLSGRVDPTLWNRFNSSSFVGNVELCGYSISAPCPSAPPSPPPSSIVSPSSSVLPNNQPGRGRKLSTKDIIFIAAGAILLLLLILCCLLLCFLIRKKSAAAARSRSKHGKSEISMPVVQAAGGDVETGETGGKLVHFSGTCVFTADDLLCATAEIMGKSTYGTSYKATLEDGNMVAVKRLREKVTKPQKEFEAEVSELGKKIRHANILALRAYYLGPKGEKLLVFDYMPHGSLASFLHARGPESVISWPTRFKIIVGITKGLVFLHNYQEEEEGEGEETCIVHGNLTSSNVLLDEQKNPCIADVGLSRLMTSAANTNVIATAGTLGYRAPELSKLKNANTKTDVYSLGVIMLELLTGKSPSEATDGLDLPQWVASIVKEEWTNEVFDLELMRDPANAAGGGDELLSSLKLAMHCVDPSPEERPEASQVLEKLHEIKPEAQSSVDPAAAHEVAVVVPSKSD